MEFEGPKYELGRAVSFGGRPFTIFLDYFLNFASMFSCL